MNLAKMQLDQIEEFLKQRHANLNDIKALSIESGITTTDRWAKSAEISYIYKHIFGKLIYEVKNNPSNSI